MPIRLQKYMAEAGIASRRKCEEYIRQGRVRINGAVAAIGQSVEEGDRVELDGREITPVQERIAIMLNKPQGVVCTSYDPEGRRTVIDYVKELPYRLYCVGRLDYDSEGLVLLTNDGELAHRLTHPSFEAEKTYFAVCNGRIGRDETALLENGINLEDGVTAPARVANVTALSDGRYSFEITIHEGRNRQVRRMIAALGLQTLLLRRIRVDSLELGGLPLGKWRRLTAAELDNLRRE